MITATPSGNNWYVEGDRYKVLVNKAGISQLFLKESGAPATNVLYGSGLVFNEAWGQTSGQVGLGNTDSSLTLVEANAVRVVLLASGFYEPGTGGTKYGTGSARLVFYHDRFVVEAVSQFTTTLGSGMRLRPLVATLAFATARADYLYDTDGAGGFTQATAAGGWTTVQANIGGPLTVQTAHPLSALPSGLMTVVVKGYQNFSTFDLGHTLATGTYVAWRAQKSDAVINQRYRAVSTITFATAPVSGQLLSDVASRVRDDISRTDPVDGGTNAGIVLTGARTTTSPGDEDTDSYNERDGAYALAPSNYSGSLDMRFDDRRAGEVSASFLRPVFRLVNWMSDTTPIVYRFANSIWHQLTEGVDFRTTADADEATVGEGVRVVQILTDVAGAGPEGPRFRFFEISPEDPSPSDWSLNIAGATIDMEAAKVSLTRFSNSWRRGRVLEFSQAATHTEGSWAEGAEVELLFKGARVFLGDICERALVGAPGDEQVAYRCLDLRCRAQRVNVTDPATLQPRVVFNAPTTDGDYDQAKSGFTVGRIVKWLFDTYSADLIAKGAAQSGVTPYEQTDLDGLDGVPPKLTLVNLNFDEALRYILLYDPEVVYTAEPATRKFRFRRAGAFGTRKATYNSADRPLGALIRPTLEGRYTAYTIIGQGERVTRAAYLSEGALEEYWGGRALTTAPVSAGGNVTIPVDNVDSFAVGDSVVIGAGSSAETTTLTTVTAPATLKANLTKAHASASVVTNKAYLESKWTAANAVSAGDSDSGTVTSGAASQLTDTSKNWAVDRWNGGEVTLTKTGYTQKRSIIDSGANVLYVSPVWTSLPAAGDTYEIVKGVNRYRFVFSRYRITDVDKRKMSQTIPDPETLPQQPVYAPLPYKPRVWRKKPDGTWVICPSVFDYSSGIFTTVVPAADGNQNVEGGANSADDMRLDYSYIGNPCQARFPATGYTGTAYSHGALEREKVRYEESFLTPASAAQYSTLASRLLWPLKDVAYRGEVTLSVVEPDWLDIGYRLNIAAVDDEGEAVATGLETVAALVATVEILFFESRTRIMLADADQLAAEGDWFKTLPDTLFVYESATAPGEPGGDGDGGGGGSIYTTIDEVAELTGGIGSPGEGEGTVTSVNAGGANGIIKVDPTTGDVVVSHNDYVSGAKTPCNYAPRWQ